MQLFKSPFATVMNVPGITEILLIEGQTSSVWEAHVSQTFDGSYTTIHGFNPAVGFFDPIRGSTGFVHPDMTFENRQKAYQPKGFRSRGTSWLFDRSLYSLGTPLVQNSQFFLRLRRFDLVPGTGGTSGTSPGAGLTYTDAAVDFGALGVTAGHRLIILTGANAGEYLVASSLGNTITLDAGTPLAGASAGDTYQVMTEEWFGNGAHVNYLIPAPYWDHPQDATITVTATAPQGTDVDESEVLVLPRNTSTILVQNAEATGSGQNLIFAFDDEGPEYTLTPEDGPIGQDVLSTHLIAFRSNVPAGTDFKLILSFS